MSKKNGLTVSGAYTNLMNALAESSLWQETEEIFDELSLAGEDPLAAATATQAALRLAGKNFRQRHLRAAAAEYKRCSATLQTRWVDLPDSPKARRELLAGIFARQPNMQNAFLTIQHREFKELSDNDVESCLVQLLELDDGTAALFASDVGDGEKDE